LLASSPARIAGEEPKTAIRGHRGIRAEFHWVGFLSTVVITIDSRAKPQGACLGMLSQNFD